MSAVAAAAEAWGDAMPDWVRTLAEACDRRSQAAVARDLGYSAAVVNRVLKAAYAGRYDTVEKAVTGALMAATVQCPVLGDLPSHQCLEIQRRPFAATNAQRVRLYRACRSCKNNITRGDKS